MNRSERREVTRMTKEQMTERLTKIQQDRPILAVNIDNAVMRLHQLDGQIQLLTELIKAEEVPIEAIKNKEV
jgi:hypothetical protein